MTVKSIFLLVPIIFVVLTFQVSAQTQNNAGNSTIQIVTPQTNITPDITGNNDKYGLTLQEDLKNKEARESASNSSVRNRIRELIENKKISMEQRREEIKVKLALVSDERKKELAVKIEEKMASISAKRTQNMSETLEKLQTILDSIKTKAGTLKQQGKDTAALDSAITNAENALANASAAVQTQAEKVYKIPISDDQTLKQNIGQVIKQLQQDLKETHQAVVNAKQTVVKAAKELSRISNAVKPT